MSDTAIIFTKKDHIGYITLNFPDEGNMLTGEMAQELDAIGKQINRDSDIYVVILTGAGGVFCAGSELEKMAERAGAAAALKAGAETCGASRAIAGINQPVIAAINGEALGAGLELVLACDIRLAGEKARFGLPQVTLGLVPTEGGTQRLPRLVGRGKALEMLLTGEIMDAATALETGLVHRVVADDKLAAEAEAMAKAITTRAPVALKFVKEAINKGLDLTAEQGLRLEADLYFLLHTTADRTEGINAYLQKRPPDFKGR